MPNFEPVPDSLRELLPDYVIGIDPLGGDIQYSPEMQAKIDAYDHTELPFRVARGRGHAPVRVNPESIRTWRGRCETCGMDLVATKRGTVWGDAFYKDCPSRVEPRSYDYPAGG